MVVEWQDYGVSHTFASSPLRNHQYLLLYTHTHTMYSIHTYEARPEAKFEVFLILVILGILVMEKNLFTKEILNATPPVETFL